MHKTGQSILNGSFSQRTGIRRRYDRKTAPLIVTASSSTGRGEFAGNLFEAPIYPLQYPIGPESRFALAHVGLAVPVNTTHLDTTNVEASCAICLCTMAG
jgi:hypothetical protein